MTEASVPAIGVFDSGVGGISVLRALRSRLPGAPLDYLADSAFAPYGDRSREEIVERSKDIVEHLRGRGARMIVVACNTATTAAIQTLRKRWPDLPFVGVEPGIKPAVALSERGRIAVVATRRTIDSDRLRSLVEQHAGSQQVLLMPWPGLVDAIERHDDEAVQALLQRYCQALKAEDVDTVVLGCTHYPFVAEKIALELGPSVKLVDTAEAVASRALSVWQGLGLAPQGAGLRLQTTGDSAKFDLFARRWLGEVPAAEVASF